MKRDRLLAVAGLAVAGIAYIGGLALLPGHHVTGWTYLSMSIFLGIPAVIHPKRAGRVFIALPIVWLGCALVKFTFAGWPAPAWREWIMLVLSLVLGVMANIIRTEKPY